MIEIVLFIIATGFIIGASFYFGMVASEWTENWIKNKLNQKQIKSKIK